MIEITSVIEITSGIERVGDRKSGRVGENACKTLTTGVLYYICTTLACIPGRLH